MYSGGFDPTVNRRVVGSRGICRKSSSNMHGLKVLAVVKKLNRCPIAVHLQVENCENVAALEKSGALARPTGRWCRECNPEQRRKNVS
jgi:hypothetical protein